MNELGFYYDGNSYEQYMVHKDGDYYCYSHHRLLAIAEFGFGEVKGKDVHHKNGVRIDNRRNNLVALSKSEHGKLHRSNKQSYSKKECINALKRVKKKIGKRPTKRDYKNVKLEDEPSTSVIKNRFGTWKNVIENVFGKPDYKSKDKLQSALENNRTFSEVADQFDVAKSTVRNWVNEHELSIGDSSYSKEEVIEFVRYADKITDGELTQNKYDEVKIKNKPCSGTIVNKIGGWDKAKKIALDSFNVEDCGKTYSKMQCQKVIRKFVFEQGKEPSISEFDSWKKDSMPCASTIANRIGNGSWTKAKDEILPG